MKDWMTMKSCSLAPDKKESTESDQKMRQREYCEPQCVRFDLNKNPMLSGRVMILFLLGGCKHPYEREEESSTKMPSKIQPTQTWEGALRAFSTRSRADSLGHTSQVCLTCKNEWPDSIRSALPRDTLHDLSPEPDSSRFAWSMIVAFTNCVLVQNLTQKKPSERSDFWKKKVKE